VQVVRTSQPRDDYRHIAWATIKFTPNVFVTKRDNLMLITTPVRDPAEDPGFVAPCSWRR